MPDEITYPVTKETMHDYAKSIFDPILKGECVTAVWVPMAGRRMWNRFIIEHINLFEKELPNYDKYLLVYVEPLDLTEESLVGYLKLMGKSFVEIAKSNKIAREQISDEDLKIFTNDTSTYPVLLEELRKLLLRITDSGLEVVFFLGEFDELTFATKIFFNNLKSLWARLYPRLHYIFLMVNNVESQDYFSYWDELGEAIRQNIIYIPLRRDTDFDYVLDTFAGKYNVALDENKKRIIKEVCGGHPYSMIVAVRFLRDSQVTSNEEFRMGLLDNYELRSIAVGIFDRRSENEKEALKKIFLQVPLSLEEEKTILYLKKLGFVIEKDHKYNFFSFLFKRAVEIAAALSAGDGGELTLDERTGAILYNGKTVEESFTRQEYSILTLFLKNQDRVLTRDDIGSVLWGESNYEKYSDWAIDQLMSKLRKKLKQIGVDVEIATLRGRGYKFTQS